MSFDVDWEMLVRDTYNEAPRPQVEQFIYVCRHTQLDPLTRQIYMIRRGGKWQIQASIDGFRAVAARTGRYEGQVGPFWCGPDGLWRDVWLEPKAPSAAKIGVLAQGNREPTWGVARLEAYSAGGPMWGKMPDVMLAKCAEALALRKVFPSELSGVYTSDEMDQAGEGKVPAPAKPLPNRTTHPNPTPQEVVAPTLAALRTELPDLSPLDAEAWLDRLRVCHTMDPENAMALYDEAVRTGKIT